MTSGPVIALAGRPNTGKTTLFNALTGLRQRVANFAGCTVEKAVGVLELKEREAEIVDLPGTFSIVPSSEDERLAFGFLQETAASGRPLRVLCVGEASNLQNCLGLALSLKSRGYAVALVINMIDEAEINGIRIDSRKLAAELGMPVFLVAARVRRGLADLEAFLETDAPESKPEPPVSDAALAQLHEAAARQAEDAINRCVFVPRRRLLPTIERSIKLDRWLFHPLAGPLILGATMFIVFQALFSLGKPLGDLLTGSLAVASDALRARLPFPILQSFLCDGFIPGVGAVVTFLPQIAILFILIGILEQSGYLPRAGAMVDRALRPFGLDGKVFIPFLSSFACAIPGVMAARTIPNEKRRLTAILLAPLMTCSARIPVYTLIIAAFVPAGRLFGINLQGLVLAGMYLFGIATALTLALVIKATGMFEDAPPPPTVLPPYRFPKLKELVPYVYVRCEHFVGRAGKVIFGVALVLWALAAFPRHPELTQGLAPAAAAAVQIEHSALGMVGRVIEPVFKPIGYDWRVAIAVLSSLAAREVFVGTLGTIFALGGDASARTGLIEALRGHYGLPTAVSLLLFFAVALQCVSTIAIVRRETGTWKWPAIQFATFFAIAYALSYAGFHLTRLLGG